MSVPDSAITVNICQSAYLSYSYLQVIVRLIPMDNNNMQHHYTSCPPTTTQSSVTRLQLQYSVEYVYNNIMLYK